MPAQRRPDDMAAVNPYGVVNNTANRTIPHKIICKDSTRIRLKRDNSISKIA